jgi:hypothetical protein
MDTHQNGAFAPAVPGSACAVNELDTRRETQRWGIGPYPA